MCMRSAGMSPRPFAAACLLASTHRPASPHPAPLAPRQGTAIERFAQMTDWGYYEAARRFQRVLVASGIDSALRAKGVLVRAAIGLRRGGGRAASVAPPGRLSLVTKPAQPAHGLRRLVAPPYIAPSSIALQDGDTVVIGDLEFEYSSDKSESTMCVRGACACCLSPALLLKSAAPLGPAAPPPPPLTVLSLPEPLIPLNHAARY